MNRYGLGRRIAPLLFTLCLAAPTSAEVRGDQERSLLIEKHYLHLPVKGDAPLRKVTLLVDGRPERTLDIKLAEGEPQWWAFLDVTAWRGRTVTVRVAQPAGGSAALDAIEQGDAIKGGDDLYRERLRPQFHFSSRRGWNNDPNGLVFYRGEYHLFYQHNPYGWEWGNMHWGHAVSRDLVHWQELGDVLAPDDLGPMFSGSAVVDWKNSSGFGKDGEPPLVLIYTAAGRPAVQCLAYSHDGRTFTKYAGNPVVPQITAGNRDPKVFWHEPSGRWVMVLYVGLPDPDSKKDEKGRPVPKHTIHFLTSPDLKEWTVRSRIEGFYECPDFFELPVDGTDGEKTWVLSAANTNYMLGRFDGERFLPETPILTGQRGGAFYAPQTFSDLPDGRRVQIGWGRMPSPGMPFNQMMCFPCELSLRRTSEGPRLCWRPVRELSTIETGRFTLGAPARLGPGAVGDPLEGVKGELLDLRAEFDPGDAAAVGFDIRGTQVVYDARKRELVCRDRRAPLAAEGGRVRLQVLADRTSLEIFGGDGLVYMPMACLPGAEDTSVGAFAREGTATLHALDVRQVHSIWSTAQESRP
jgi:sucrose-6-phosphate hydrolase SacC (GH32 family)